MTPDEVTLAVIDALESAGLRYLIVGSLSSNFHGVPRATQDADFVVEVAAGDITRLAAALPATLVLESQAGFETVTGSLRYVIAAAGNPFICELFVHSDDPHDVERMRRRLRVSILGRQTFVATAEARLSRSSAGPPSRAAGKTSKMRETSSRFAATNSTGVTYDIGRGCMAAVRCSRRFDGRFPLNRSMASAQM